MSTQTDAEAKRKVWDMIQDIGVAMMVSHHGDHLHGRPMVAAQREFDGSLWFFTRYDAPKVDEMARDPRVLLAYSDASKQNYVSVFGHATVTRDREAIDQHWQESLRTWFPEGKDDPEVAIIKVDLVGAEYWDSPSSTMVHAYGYVKAAATGEPPSPGDVQKVQF